MNEISKEISNREGVGVLAQKLKRGAGGMALSQEVDTVN